MSILVITNTNLHGHLHKVSGRIVNVIVVEASSPLQAVAAAVKTHVADFTSPTVVSPTAAVYCKNPLLMAHIEGVTSIGVGCINASPHGIENMLNGTIANIAAFGEMVPVVALLVPWQMPLAATPVPVNGNNDAERLAVSVLVGTALQHASGMIITTAVGANPPPVIVAVKVCVADKFGIDGTKITPLEFMVAPMVLVLKLNTCELRGTVEVPSTTTWPTSLVPVVLRQQLTGKTYGPAMLKNRVD